MIIILKFGKQIKFLLCFWWLFKIKIENGLLKLVKSLPLINYIYFIKNINLTEI